jgi:glutamyl-tRNA reductase
LQAEFPEMEMDWFLMEDMWKVIQAADVVYPSTAATSTIIDPEPLRACLQTRAEGRGGVQFVDISVPRNVHPDCAAVEKAFCYNVDDLKLVVRTSSS